MADFLHVHTSSRYSRSPESLERAIRKHMARPRAGLITVTEVDAENREAALRRACVANVWQGITGDKGGMDDTAVLWSQSKFDLIHAHTELLKSAAYSPNQNGHISTTGVTMAVLRERSSGKRVLVSVCHMPSSVEDAGRFKATSHRVRAWYAHQKAWKRAINRVSANHDVDAVLIVADWNTNIKAKFFQNLFPKLFPGMKPTLNYKRLPLRGTLGKRLIDFAFMRGRIKVVKRPWILAHDDSSDHTPFAQLLRL